MKGMIFLLLFCSCLQSIWAIEKSDWPWFRGEKQDGISRDPKLKGKVGLKAPKVLWKKNIFTGYSSMSVVGQRLYTAGHENKQDHIYCLDAQTGKEIWKYSYNAALDPKMYAGGPNATPTVVRDRVIMLSREGEVIALNAKDGQLIWSQHIRNELRLDKPSFGFSSSPVVLGDRIILCAGAKGLALDFKTGKILWKNKKKFSGYSSPIPLDKETVLIFDAKHISGIDLKTGELKWEERWKTNYDMNSALPLLLGNNEIFVSSADQGGRLKINENKVTTLWKNKVLKSHFNSAIYLNGALFGFTGTSSSKGKTFTCVDAKTGELKWEHEGFGVGSLVAADDKLLVLTDKGELVILDADPAKYLELQRLKILSHRCWTSPAIANGLLYARDEKGELVCVQI